jgi:transcriptional regulator with XRE-family HTH domain
MEIKEKVGVALKAVRERKNLSQEKLAKISGIDRTFISHIENGGRNVSIETLEKLLIGMKVGFVTFFKDEIFRS